MKSRHPEKNSGQAELTQISRIPIKYFIYKTKLSNYFSEDKKVLIIA